MKRKLINSISIIILLCLVAIPTYANQTIKIIVNGKIISCQNPPQIVNGRVMVPIRTVGEALNVDVDWQPESWYNGPVGPWHVYINNGYKQISMYPNETVVTINDNGIRNNIIIDTPVKVIKGSVYVPISIISKILNCNVLWEKETSTIKINYSHDIAQEVLNNWSDSVVSIQTESGQGTGLIFADLAELDASLKNHYQVATCAHLLAEKKDISVTFRKKSFKCDLIFLYATSVNPSGDRLEGPYKIYVDYASNAKSDYDLTRLVLPAENESFTPLSLINKADTSLVKTGDTVYILEASNSDKKIVEGNITSIQSIDGDNGPIKLFGTNAPVDDYASGAPVFDSKGQILGVLKGPSSETGEYLIIPMSYL
ncbi:stalk domain-containing protein [Candidatus Formimonas warabiya]|uniref:Copper amine oxidase-like N-terminal domain-containing protein n=1 Tax=Formimonas warabiya TaxID=1761012 RepID=A0A3G1KQ18_FORW1|nr:stalk domain-containing protein [Candidatus Formimonas warabiya]ATW24573.1 hypothetical protein DCMF_07045 [Candidatus Formimonas warabiya]